VGLPSAGRLPLPATVLSAVVALRCEHTGHAEWSKALTGIDYKALIREFVQRVWNSHDTSAVGNYHADTFLLNGEPFTPEQFARNLTGLFAFYTDLVNSIEAMVAEGDRVAYRWVFRGTDPRNGTQRSWRGMSMSTFVDGKIVEEWYNSEQTDADVAEIGGWLHENRADLLPAGESGPTVPGA
jgi:predicted ester cyclase